MYTNLMTILLTGGTGYIGSHTAVELLQSGHEVVIVDSLINSSETVIDRIEQITGKRPIFYKVNLCDKPALKEIFGKHPLDAVIHFAGLKAVAESVQIPLSYYRNNIDSTLSLLEVMKANNVHKLVFSSSATVYGSAPYPYEETMQTGVGITSPYGHTKYMIEEILRDTAAADNSCEFMSLRYFNPVGAHESGLIGEEPTGTPNNLMPFITQTAAGRREKLHIFGNDYDTIDGTCVRDFIHVVDLAKGHAAALEHLQPGFDAINLGSGKGTSVLELVKTFETSTGQKVPYDIAPRRTGDLPEFYANANKAKQILNWVPTKTLPDMCRDAWRWESQPGR